MDMLGGGNMQSEREAKELIRQVAQEKRRRLDGGGPDFRGSLKRLVDVWPDPSHSLIELLQNADDANASSVEYKLNEEGIVFSHNGKPFTEEDVWAWTPKESGAYVVGVKVVDEKEMVDTRISFVIKEKIDKELLEKIFKNLTLFLIYWLKIFISAMGG